MNETLLTKAKKLADRPYEVQLIPDIDTDGDPVVFARIPEMPGCVSHGETIEEAMEWIELAKIDFIYFYLEDGLTPPAPAGFQSENNPHMSVLELGEDSKGTETVSFSKSGFRNSDLEQPIHTHQYVYA